MPAKDLLANMQHQQLDSNVNNAITNDHSIYRSISAKNQQISDKNLFSKLREDNVKLCVKSEIGSGSEFSNERTSNFRAVEKAGINQEKSCLTKPENSNVCDCKTARHEKNQYFFKSEAELRTYSIGTLKAVIKDLVSAIEDASGQLVSLLQENDTLQQESDARNIAIEQLLKLTVKQTEAELRPVQMSVVLPSGSDDEWD